MDFHNLQKSNFVRGKNLKIQSSIKLSWGHVRSDKKFGPVRYSRFDVYWIQTNKQNINRFSNSIVTVFIARAKDF